MSSKVRMIAAFAFAFALGAGAAKALPPPAHRPEAPVPTAGLVDTAHAWLGSWTGAAPGGSAKLSTARGHEGSNIDPNGFLGILLNLLKPPAPPPTDCPPGH